MTNTHIMLKPHHFETGIAFIHFLNKNSDFMQGFNVSIKNKNICFDAVDAEGELRALLLSSLIASYTLDRTSFFIDGKDVSSRTSWRNTELEPADTLINVEDYDPDIFKSSEARRFINELHGVKKDFDKWRSPLNFHDHSYLNFLVSRCVSNDEKIEFSEISVISNYFDDLYKGLDFSNCSAFQCISESGTYRHTGAETKNDGRRFLTALYEGLKSISNAGPANINSLQDLIFVFTIIIYTADLKSRFFTTHDLLPGYNLSDYSALINLNLKKVENYIRNDTDNLSQFIDLATFLDQLSNNNADGHWVPGSTDTSTDVELFDLFLKWAFGEYPDLLSALLLKAELGSGGLEYYTLDDLSIDTRRLLNVDKLTCDIPKVDIEF